MSDPDARDRVAALLLEADGAPVPFDELVEKSGIEKSFVRQIIGDLRHYGLVRIHTADVTNRTDQTRKMRHFVYATEEMLFPSFPC